VGRFDMKHANVLPLKSDGNLVGKIEELNLRLKFYFWLNALSRFFTIKFRQKSMKAKLRRRFIDLSSQKLS